MAEPSAGDVTRLLAAWSDGDPKAGEALTPLIAGELRRLARGYMARERPDHTLQTTALINEAFVRLCEWKSAGWKDRAHFFAVSARLMRNVLVDSARAKHYRKRGGEMQRVPLDEVAVLSKASVPDYLELDEALTRLEAVDRRKSQAIELSFFGGLTVDEMAEVLQVSPSTVVRDLGFAKAWLRRGMSAQTEEEASPAKR